MCPKNRFEEIWSGTFDKLTSKGHQVLVNDTTKQVNTLVELLLMCYTEQVAIAVKDNKDFCLISKGMLTHSTESPCTIEPPMRVFLQTMDEWM